MFCFTVAFEGIVQSKCNSKYLCLDIGVSLTL
jgi:hypothetical protein